MGNLLDGINPLNGLLSLGGTDETSRVSSSLGTLNQGLDQGFDSAIQQLNGAQGKKGGDKVAQYAAQLQEKKKEVDASLAQARAALGQVDERAAAQAASQLQRGDDIFVGGSPQTVGKTNFGIVANFSNGGRPSLNPDGRSENVPALLQRLQQYNAQGAQMQGTLLGNRTALRQQASQNAGLANNILALNKNIEQFSKDETQYSEQAKNFANQARSLESTSASLIQAAEGINRAADSMASIVNGLSQVPGVGQSVAAGLQQLVAQLHQTAEDLMQKATQARAQAQQLQQRSIQSGRQATSARARAQEALAQRILYQNDLTMGVDSLQGLQKDGREITEGLRSVGSNQDDIVRTIDLQMGGEADPTGQGIRTRFNAGQEDGGGNLTTEQLAALTQAKVQITAGTHVNAAPVQTRVQVPDLNVHG